MLSVNNFWSDKLKLASAFHHNRKLGIFGSIMTFSVRDTTAFILSFVKNGVGVRVECNIFDTTSFCIVIFYKLCKLFTSQ
jgi:hypothetical protein